MRAVLLFKLLLFVSFVHAFDPKVIYRERSHGHIPAEVLYDLVGREKAKIVGQSTKNILGEQYVVKTIVVRKSVANTIYRLDGVPVHFHFNNKFVFRCEPFHADTEEEYCEAID